MKKFLSYVLVALMLVACVSVAVSAVDFVAGKGYTLYSGASYGEAVDEGKAPVTMTVNDDGSVSVEQAGYYKDPKGDENFGGVATAEKVGLNGLEVEITFEEVPAVTSSTDCWFGIHLMEYPRVFNASAMTDNRGYVPLIRFNRPNVEFYNGVTGFTGIGQSEINPAIFGFKAGDVVKMSVKYELGQFIVSYDHNGEIYDVPADRTLELSDAVFADGTAYVVVTGTRLGMDSNFKYTVKVTEGAALTAEQIASKEFEKSKKAASDEIDNSIDQIEGYFEDAVEEAEGITDDSIAAAIAEIESAMMSAEAAKAALLAATEQTQVDEALAAALAAKDAAKNAGEAVTMIIENGDFADDTTSEEAPVDTPADETPADEADETPADDEADEEGGVNVGLIIAIIAIVVVIVVVVVVVLKKKKK